MKILILGYGVVGSVLVKLLSKEKQIEKIVCADINFKEDKYADKFYQRKLDLKDEEKLFELFEAEKPDLVVNAVSPDFNEDILDACAEIGLNYMDMAADWDVHPDENARSPYKIEQLDFDAKFKEKNIFGLIESGVSPGLTNLVISECADEMKDIDSVKIRLLDYSGTNELTFSWSKEALLDEINSKPLVYENGKFRIAEPFSGEEEFDYPPPFGKKIASLICQDEIGTIPFYIKLKNIDIKDFDNQVDVHKFLYRLGLISTKKVKIGNTEISPFDFMCKILPDVTLDYSNKKFDDAQFGFVIQANEKKKNKEKIIRYSVMFPKQKEINDLKLNANFISYPTALSAKLFIMAVSKIKTKGVFPPEALEKEVRKSILRELRKMKNIKFRKEVVVG